jgi:hypothetical protein
MKSEISLLQIELHRFSPGVYQRKYLPYHIQSILK